MPLQYLFWGLYIACWIFALVWAPTPFSLRGNAGNIVLLILIGILGYQAFGSAVRH